jgi:hypothetical protein
LGGAGRGPDRLSRHNNFGGAGGLSFLHARTREAGTHALLTGLRARIVTALLEEKAGHPERAEKIDEELRRHGHEVAAA